VIEWSLLGWTRVEILVWTLGGTSLAVVIEWTQGWTHVWILAWTHEEQTLGTILDTTLEWKTRGRECLVTLA
jgi:hypothetical protein